MINGRLDRRAVRRATHAVLAEAYQHVQVLRGRHGSEVRVGEFRTRIAATNSTHPDTQSVAGDSSAQIYVLYAPEGIDLRKGDELWTTGGGRYRVVTLDSTPGARQILAEAIQ